MIGSIISNVARRVSGWVVRRIVSLRLFNPWFYTPEGQEFLCGMFERLRTARGFSRATRAAHRRYYVTQPLFIIPWKRWQFKRRHGFWPPGFVAISPTRRCNLACPGCFSGHHQNEDMPLDTADRIVREAKAMGIYMYVLIGGEPLCWPHFFTLLERHRECTFGVYTNGTLLTEAMAARLAALGNANLDFSVEGFEQETDARRGAGVFARVMQSMALCRTHGVHFGYSVTVTRQNSEVVASDEFINFMAAQGCFVGWYYQYMPVGDAPDHALMPTAEQRAHRRQRLAEIRRANTITVFDFLNDGPLVGGCICAGRYYLHITCSGAVEPCAFYPFAVDNINEKSLADVLHSAFFQQVRARQGTTPNPLAPCPVIDHPHWLRAAVQTSAARPSQASATLLLGGLSAPLDGYAQAYAALVETAAPGDRR